MEQSLKEMIEGNIFMTVLTLLGAGFLGGLSTYGFLLRFKGFQGIKWFNPHSADPCPQLTVVQMMKSSVLPMYLADKDMKVIYCNDAHVRFTGIERENIVGKTISDLVDKIRPLISEEDLELFNSEQRSLAKRAFTGKFPNADATYIFDLRQHLDREYRFKYKVWIHVDRLPSASYHDSTGMLGIFHVEKIEEQNGNGNFNNRLNDEGLRNLLELHFGTVLNKQMYIIEEVFLGKVHLNGDELFQRFHNCILESRAHVAPFKIVQPPTVVKLLFGDLDEARMKELIENDLKAILSDTATDQSTKRNKAYHYIRSQQVAFMNRVITGLKRASSGHE